MNILAKNDHTQAQHALGIIYLFEDYVEQDHALGVELLRKAAEKDYIDAQMALAQCYEDGIGVKKNRYDAIFWYRKAAAQGSEEAQERATDLEDF